jgi:hypothetical protein
MTEARAWRLLRSIDAGQIWEVSLRSRRGDRVRCGLDQGEEPGRARSHAHHGMAVITRRRRVHRPFYGRPVPSVETRRAIPGYPEQG